MIKPRILDKNLLMMREQFGTATHQFNGEKIDICRSLNGMSIIIGYKGEFVIWDVKDMAEKSIELIDKQDEEG